MPALSIAAWIAVLAAAGAVGACAVNFMFWAYDEWHKRKPHQGFLAPKKTLNLAPKPREECWWRIGKRREGPTMHIAGTMGATNISPVPIRVAQAELRYGFLGRKRISGTVMASGSMGENIYGAFDIQPNERRDLTFEFWVYPPVRDSWETFTPHSLTFIDQFGNKHSVKRITFLAHLFDASVRLNAPKVFLYELV
jgi:hypothetical protein